MRRTVASKYEAAGGNATALMDHTKRSVTLLYLDPKIAKQPQVIDLLSLSDSAPRIEHRKKEGGKS